MGKCPGPFVYIEGIASGILTGIPRQEIDDVFIVYLPHLIPGIGVAVGMLGMKQHIHLAFAVAQHHIQPGIPALFILDAQMHGGFQIANAAAQDKGILRQAVQITEQLLDQPWLQHEALRYILVIPGGDRGIQNILLSDVTAPFIGGISIGVGIPVFDGGQRIDPFREITVGVTVRVPGDALHQIQAAVLLLQQEVAASSGDGNDTGYLRTLPDLMVFFHQIIC